MLGDKETIRLYSPSLGALVEPGGGRITFAELEARTARIAGGLAALGVGFLLLALIRRRIGHDPDFLGSGF